MTMTSETSRNALSARVYQRVAAHGVSRTVVDDAVRQVLLAIASRGGSPPASESSFVVAVTARSLPDLASRLRRDLEQEGVVILDIGIGSAGQHTVVTLRLHASARPAMERVAERSRYSMSYLNGVA
jgi:hypothetical protein